MINPLSRLLVFCLVAVTVESPATAQTPARESVPVVIDTLTSLRAAIVEREREREALDRMLVALNDVDSVYKAHCPRWVVRDEDLRQRVLKMFRLRRGDPIPESEVLVVANPQESQILELRAGNVFMGRRDARMIMSDSLQHELLFATYPRRYIEEIPARPRNPVVFGGRPRFAALSVSAFAGALLFGDGSGVEVQLGHEEIGYHFWSTGSVQVTAMFEDFKVGILAPLSLGTSHPDLIQPLTIRPRKLTGTKGVILEYDPEVFSGRLSARFSIGGVTGVTNPELLADTGPVYSVHTIAQLTYAQRVSPAGYSGQLTLRGGIGFHQISAGEVMPGGVIVTTAKDNFVSPILDAEYVHYGERQYGIGAQYCSAILFAKAWVEIVRDFIFVDVKYYTPIFRAAKPWEQPYFFMVSPRIQVVY
jgi:hypothetical protein